MRSSVPTTTSTPPALKRKRMRGFRNMVLGFAIIAATLVGAVMLSGYGVGG